MSTLDKSVHSVLKDIRKKYPDAPFLALGQTVWWDEPMKAVLRRMLDTSGLGGRMILGVHDTDYFAKVKVRRAGQARFELMPHNDGSTKDLWSAAGEVSRLFGSETFPRRHDFLSYGIPLERLASSKQESDPEFINRSTEAWGWRGLVYTGRRDLIVNRLALKDMGESLEQMLKYGFDGTIECLADECCRNEARQLATRLLGWVSDYRTSHPDATLSDLYQHLFPRLFELLLGSASTQTDITSTTDLLRLTPDTARLPRFQFVDLFLKEQTRKIAADAYNAAVASSEMYTLDRFGLGALPFDVYVPDRGRGTLRITLRAVHIEFGEPVRIRTRTPVGSVQELASVLNAELGDSVTLVGKAVALISMLAQEFIFVFNEEGSQYVARTQRMNDFLAERGVELNMHPILRMRYCTWDSLDVGHATLVLPDHLEAAFGTRDIAAAEFAARWTGVVAEQRNQLDRVKAIRAPRDLMSYLDSGRKSEWGSNLSEYNALKSRLRENWQRAASIQTQVNRLYYRLNELKAQIRQLEIEKGAHFRSTAEWTTEQNFKREGFTRSIKEALRERRLVIEQIIDLKEKRLSVERCPEAVEARRRITEIEIAAEEERLRIVRNALLTVEGLPHTQHRPTAWWLPMVDPCGHWFERVVATTDVYTQPLISQ